MKKTILFTSIAALALVLGLGACETTSEEDVTPSESETTSQSSETTPSTETNPDGYVLVGDFTDSNWDAKVDTSSKYYIPLGTTEYKATVTIAAEPDYGEYDPWDAGLRVVEWGDSWNLVVGSDELDEASTGVTGSDSSKNIKVNWGETYDITVTFGDTNSILVTVHEDGGDGGQGVSTYKLGAADPSTGVYYYFNGSTRSTTETNLFLATTTSWDEAVAVTITDLTSGGQSLSYVDTEGATKYIAWDGENGNTSIQIYDEPCAWYWIDSINGYYTLSDGTDTTGRFLALYASGPDFRAYNPTDQYLAYGHVAAYTEEPETITPEPEPEGEFPFEVGKDYFLGYDRSGTIYYYNGEVLNTYYGDVSTDISKAAKVTLGASGDKYTLQLENGKYLGADFGDHANFKWDLETAYEWEYNSTYQTFVAYNSSNTAYCLGTSGTYNEIQLFTLSSAASNYPATLYEIPSDWAPYEEPEIDEESFQEVKTGKLGLYQENKNAYYYFTGAKDGNFGAMSTNWEQGVDVTLLTDETYYYIRFTSNGQTLYFGHTDSSNSQVALNSNPYPLQYDETHGAYLNTDGSRFLGTYSTYETLSWSEVSYINNSGQFIATIYESEQEQPEHEPDPELPEGTITTTITYETIMNLDQFSGVNWSTSSQTCFSSTDGVLTSFDGFGITWYTDASGSSNGCAIYSAQDLRIYKYAHFDIAATEGYEIYSTEVYTSSNGNNNLTCTNGSNTVWANYTYTTDGPADTTAPIVYANGYAGSKNPVIGYITVIVAPVA